MILVNGFGSCGMLLFTRILEYVYKKEDKFENVLYDEYEQEFFTKYINLYNINDDEATFFVNTDIKFHNSYGIKVTKPKTYIDKISILESSMTSNYLIDQLPTHTKFYLHRDARDSVVSMLNRIGPSEENLLFGLSKNDLASSDFVVLAYSVMWKKHIQYFLEVRNMFFELSFFRIKNDLEALIDDVARYLEINICSKEVIDHINMEDEQSTLEQKGKKFGKYLDFFTQESIDLIEYICGDELIALDYMTNKTMSIYSFNDLRLYTLDKSSIKVSDMNNAVVSIFGVGNIFINTEYVLKKYFKINHLIDDAAWHAESKNHAVIPLNKIDLYDLDDFIIVCAAKIYTNVKMTQRLLEIGVCRDKILCIYPINIK